MPHNLYISWGKLAGRSNSGLVLVSDLESALNTSCARDLFALLPLDCFSFFTAAVEYPHVCLPVPLR